MIKREGMAGWQQAFVLALGFHIALFLLFFFYPSIWHKKITIPTSYNVQLFEPSAVKSQENQQKVRTEKKAPERKRPLLKRKEVSVHKKEPVVHRRVPKKALEKKQVKSVNKTTKKAISLKPKKITKKKVQKRPKKKTKTALKKTNRRHRIDEEKRLTQRIKKLEEKVREKKEDQLLKERLARIQKKIKSASASAPGHSGSFATKGPAVNDALRRYAGAIWMHVRKNWHFPEELLKRKDLEAIISIRIDKNGHILSKKFERRSGFASFDRSAMKAVQDSDPLPPLPTQLGSGPIEIGIRFNPSRMNSPQSL